VNSATVVKSFPWVSTGVRKIKASGPATASSPSKTLTPPHPRQDVPVIEADDQFHLHRDFSAQAFDDADDVRVLARAAA